MSNALDHLLKAAANAGITSKRELANFLAQVKHESAGFTRLEESFHYRQAERVMAVVRSTQKYGLAAVQQAVNAAKKGQPERLADMMYGGRMGNNAPGDGYKYRGRGYIQLTGKSNYDALGKRLGLDFINQPDLAAQPEIAAKIAVDFWTRNVPVHARESVQAATRAINGGLNGLEERQRFFAAYLNQFDHGAGDHQINSNRTTLARGDRGDRVLEIQSLLVNHAGANIVMDGVFGPGTERAVKAFQQDNHLNVDGVVGQQTLAVLQARSAAENAEGNATGNSAQSST